MEILLLLLQILGVVGCSIAAFTFWVLGTWPILAFAVKSQVTKFTLGLSKMIYAGIFLSLALWQSALYGWL